MNLLKAGGTIGGLTMVSRIIGFAREMIFARVMGASAAAEVFIWAFQLPNLLRRLLGEGRGIERQPFVEGKGLTCVPWRQQGEGDRRRGAFFAAKAGPERRVDDRLNRLGIRLHADNM